MWAALVNPSGELCAFKPSTAEPRGVWPGSQAIAKAKAYTANSLSLDDFALATARLHTFTQPGRSLNSLGQSNRFNPEFLAAPSGGDGGKKPDCQRPHILRGAVQGGKIIGGLGVSGDTACADHETVKRACDPASLNLAGGMLAHDIV